MFAIDSRLGQAARKLDAGLEVKADLMSRKKRMQSSDPPLGSSSSPRREDKKLSI